MGCRLVQAATLAAFIHIVFTSEVIAQDPTDLDKDDVPGRMLTFFTIHLLSAWRRTIVLLVADNRSPASGQSFAGKRTFYGIHPDF